GKEAWGGEEEGEPGDGLVVVGGLAPAGDGERVGAHLHQAAAARGGVVEVHAAAWPLLAGAGLGECKLIARRERGGARRDRGRHGVRMRGERGLKQRDRLLAAGLAEIAQRKAGYLTSLHR